MRIFRKILITLAIILLVVAAAGLIFFPSHIHAERSVIIDRQQSTVFNYVNNLHNWNNWSPWYKMDPNAKYVYEGPASGVGAKLSWDSKEKKVGKGSMAITDSNPDSLVKLDLNFMENGVAKCSFHLSPEGNGTKMTWAFDTEAGANPLMRIMGSMMDKFIGNDFESGLQSLKKTLEATPVEAQAVTMPDSSATK